MTESSFETPLSPELVLVTPELVEEALRRFKPAWLDIPPPTRDLPQPASADRLHLLGTIEVTARVPVLVAVLACLAVPLVRMMVAIGAPVLLAMTVVTLLDL